MIHYTFIFTAFLMFCLFCAIALMLLLSCLALPLPYESWTLFKL